MRQWIRRYLAIVAFLGLCAVGAAWYAHGASGSPGQGPLQTAQVRHGDLVATIGATGTLEPEEVVDVGAQVAGRIDAFGLDLNHRPIDYGSVVEVGTVLAHIDDSVYAAEVAQAVAQLEQSKAAVVRAEADLGQLRAKLVQAQRDWDRARELQASEIIAQSDYDAAQAAFEVAGAGVAVGGAAIEEARKAQAQASAALDRARQDLAYCTVKSPVKGVIIDRRVNIGQTVVASLNTPSLFLIAKDLRRMQVWVSVNEADIGNIHPGQPITFTVDAYPDQIFRGEVSKVRLNAAMTQNVVTYTVEVNTDNSSGKLLPYLTANAQFEINHWNDVLMVPNGALRWEPQPVERGSGSARATDPQTSRERSVGTVWTPVGKVVRPIQVGIGATDGVSTIVEAPELKEGMPVVLGEARAGSDEGGAAANPFTPQMGRTRTGTSGRQP